MAKSSSSKRDAEREVTRRALIKWSVAAGAALGVSRSRVFDILSGSKSVAFADEDNKFCNTVHVVAGNGGLAWFQLLWPHYEVAAAGVNGTSAIHLPATTVAGTRNLAVNAHTPGIGTTENFALTAERQITAFVCGNNETHTGQPSTAISINGSSLNAMSAAMQTANSAILSAITIDDVPLGTAPGSPSASNVGSAADIVDLFNSAASRAGGILEHTSQADLYAAHYTAFAQIRREAKLSTYIKPRATATTAAKFLGTNLASQLQITQADLTRYGIDANGIVTPNNVKQFAQALIITAKAFKLGLVPNVTIPAFRDDPHGAFGDGRVMTVPVMIRDALNGFLGDLKDANLHDRTVITFTGDTTKDPTDQSGWPDGTPGNRNMMWVYGAGYLKSGWFGRIGADRTTKGWDPNTGNEVNYNGGDTAKQAVAAVCYAVARGDARAAQQSGVTNGIPLTAATVPVNV